MDNALAHISQQVATTGMDGVPQATSCDVSDVEWFVGKDATDTLDLGSVLMAKSKTYWFVAGCSRFLQQVSSFLTQVFCSMLRRKSS